MLVTREMLINQLSKESGFRVQDIKKLLLALDTVVLDCFSEVTDDEDVSIQLVTGIKVSAHVVPLRERVDPRNLQPIMVKPTVKPSCKFSSDFREKIQEQYEDERE